MSKIFKVEEGNVLRLVMQRRVWINCPNRAVEKEMYEAEERRYNNRESYPYVAVGWEIGETKELNVDFEIREMYKDSQLIAIQISKPTNK